VALVERATFPRRRAGETLHPGAETVLRALGVFDSVVAARFLRHEGVLVSWGKPAHFQSYGSDRVARWRGFQAWRAELDAILLKRACDCGAAVLQPCRALHPLLGDGGRVTGVHTSAGDVRARWTIDAGGGGHWLARELGLGLEHRSPSLIARYGYAVGQLPALKRGPQLDAEPWGWTWIAQVRRELLHWVRLAFTAGIGNGHDGPPATIAHLDGDGKVYGADVSWRLAPQAAGPGYLAVGDAAAVLDPASSHGVLRALLSGMASATVVSRGLEPKRGAEHFAQLMRSGFERDLERLRALYAELPFPPSWLGAAVRPRPVGATQVPGREEERPRVAWSNPA